MVNPDCNNLVKVEFPDKTQIKSYERQALRLVDEGDIPQVRGESACACTCVSGNARLRAWVYAHSNAPTHTQMVEQVQILERPGPTPQQALTIASVLQRSKCQVEAEREGGVQVEMVIMVVERNLLVVAVKKTTCLFSP